MTLTVASPTWTGPPILFEGVSVRRGRRTTLDDVSLEVEAGEIVGLVGPNGAGKSTMVGTLCGLIRTTGGRVLVNGFDAQTRLKSIRRSIGLVPQDTSLYDEISAMENLRLAAALYSVPSPEARIGVLLQLVGLAERAQDRVETFSGGMRRRLAIARALIHEPTIIVLDEPTLGVDHEARHQIWLHVRDLSSQGRAVLLTTNYMDEAEALCDRVALLRAGRILRVGTPASLAERAGKCLELDCDGTHRRSLIETLNRRSDVLRCEETAVGVNAFVVEGSPPERLLDAAIKAVPIKGFRVRASDLAEVFRAAVGEAVS